MYKQLYYPPIEMVLVPDFFVHRACARTARFETFLVSMIATRQESALRNTAFPVMSVLRIGRSTTQWSSEEPRSGFSRRPMTTAASSRLAGIWPPLTSGRNYGAVSIEYAARRNCYIDPRQPEPVVARGFKCSMPDGPPSETSVKPEPGKCIRARGRLHQHRSHGRHMHNLLPPRWEGDGFSNRFLHRETGWSIWGQIPMPC